MKPTDAESMEAAVIIGKLQAKVVELQTVVAKHELCHNLHGKVDAEAFADGCAQEQLKLYGCAPHADRIAKLSAAMRTLCNAATSHLHWTDSEGGLTARVLRAAVHAAQEAMK